MIALRVGRQATRRTLPDRFSIPVSMVQKQLLKFEASGLLASQLEGRTRVYAWDPRFPLREQMLALLQRALEFLPTRERQRYFPVRRRRPRRAGKP
jgi:hypothetical protein